jgi:predicted Zn-dependent protease with MMP-like domain
VGESFDDMVADALDALPPWVLERFENVEVLVEDDPPPDEPNLLGRYHGVPLTKRGTYGGVLPDTITLYRSSIERAAAAKREPLRNLIVHTVVHEVAHFFGIGDDRLRELDRY